MKKNWTRIALALGPVMLIATLSWEYARTNPDYNFLIQPWALRGHEMSHGWIIAAMGVLLLIGGLLTSWEGSMRPSISAAVTGYLVAAATAFTAFFTSIVAWGVVVLSAGAIRQTLIDAQVLFDQGAGVTGVSAQYKDTQAASGWWLAGLGATLIFIGAVGLWAKRRDIVAALARAPRQREAAETSAREIAEALEIYEREQAGTATTSQ